MRHRILAVFLILSLPCSVQAKELVSALESAQKAYGKCIENITFDRFSEIVSKIITQADAFLPCRPNYASLEKAYEDLLRLTSSKEEAKIQAKEKAGQFGADVFVEHISVGIDITEQLDRATICDRINTLPLKTIVRDRKIHAKQFFKDFNSGDLFTELVQRAKKITDDEIAQKGIPRWCSDTERLINALGIKDFSKN